MFHITIIGMGALGILFGDILTASLGRDAVTFLADEQRIQKYRQDGVFCNGRACDFQMSNQASCADLLIFAIKGNGLYDAMESAKSAVGENTIILSLLNGISSEEILAQYFPKGHIVHCIAQGMDAVKLGNKLTYSHKGELRIGTPDPALSPFVERATEILKCGGVPYVVEEDILHRLWSKWMLNVGVNQIVMVNEGTYGTVQCPGEPRDTMIAAMREVVKLSEYAKTGVTEDDLTFYVNLLDTLDPNGMPSMRQDGIAHRYSEVELFAGTVIKKAEQYGVSVPVNQMLYRRVREMETAY